MRLEAERLERLVGDFGLGGRGSGVVADDLKHLAAGVFAARVAGQFHVLFGDFDVALRVFVVVELRTLRSLQPAGQVEARGFGVEEVRHHVRDERAAADLVHLLRG